MRRPNFLRRRSLDLEITEDCDIDGSSFPKEISIKAVEKSENKSISDILKLKNDYEEKLEKLMIENILFRDKIRNLDNQNFLSENKEKSNCEKVKSDRPKENFDKNMEILKKENSELKNEIIKLRKEQIADRKNASRMEFDYSQKFKNNIFLSLDQFKEINKEKEETIENLKKKEQSLKELQLKYEEMINKKNDEIRKMASKIEQWNDKNIQTDSNDIDENKIKKSEEEKKIMELIDEKRGPGQFEKTQKL
ncbi:hypothetical protein MHBO_003350 [Bonamia ostreae]|uniref:Uncharacterized protein n=1 Tax=Bonamia ostreae TaxID=126728 RepID=A0ABV2AQ60_9EUKA